ncbi:ATP synthase F(0) complex subunit k, mitochondrial isoform X1 [Carassius auratus]|uniref:ATP synthase F(0) complex subunit k, mitochondrial isoform X1 n=5 Tax=Cyprininae TaxID=2743694 RepID=A0A6P6JGQ6_CARAU|nr:up-regulated during skeletal muscle growth protein 5-like isoform X1 [Carassius auratus]XP_052458870.1 ATP synthase membrane subunit K, mitochondrial isoform X1 [Carassius gibelio]
MQFIRPSPLRRTFLKSFIFPASLLKGTSLLEIMGGHDAGTHHQFTGIAKYFNSYTITGRRNCVLATYASIAAIILFFKLKPKKQKAVKSS